MSRRVTAAEAAELLEVPVKAIDNWKARRRIVPVSLIRGRGHGGRIPVYLLEDLRPLAERYHARVATRRENAP